MNIPPIKYGARMTREEAVALLWFWGFTKDEASEFWNEQDRQKRLAITDKVTKRNKEK